MATTQDRLNESGQVFFTFPIARTRKLANGDVEVYGPCTDGSVDEDHQRVDSRWSGKALQEWFDKGANVRVQHSPFLYPAGKGVALEVGKERTRDGQQHWVKALVAHETPAAGLVEKGILRDFSIGILDPVITYGDPTAPGGTICGGRIGEVSLVDRGSNKNTTFQIVKSVGGSPQLVCKMVGDQVTTAAPPNPITLRRDAYKAQFVTKRKKKGGGNVDSGGRDVSDLPADRFAGPDGTFPIKTKDDVSDAASLAHHADDPGAVRSKIRSIAHSALGMKDEEMPPSLQATKAADDECKTCHGKGTILEGNRDCPDCNGPKGADKTVKLGKGGSAEDAGQDEPEDSGAGGETIAEYNQDGDGDGNDNDGKGDKANKKRKGGRALRKAVLKYQRAELTKGGNNGGRTPADVEGHADTDAAESGFSSAKDKTMEPAGKHREPDGADAEDFEEDAGMHTDGDEGDSGDSVPGQDWSANKSAPSYGMRRLHDATCPAYRWGMVRKSYGLPRDVGAAIPVREIESLAMEAIVKGHAAEAEYFTGMLRTAATIQELGPDVLLDARKALPAMFPDTHPHQQTDVRPTQFTRGYLGAGRPTLTAGSEAGHSSLPSAVVHEVSANDFQRGFISAGHSSMSPDGGTQARAGTAAFGQATNTLAQMHQRVAMLWPDMCPISPELRDYTMGEGNTGIRPGATLTTPKAPGEAANKAAPEETRTEAKLRKKLAKSVASNRALQEEVDLLGSLPDPEHAPYRGLPVLDGPVDRDSYVGKSVGAGSFDPESGDDAEFLEYMNGLAATGDPRLRLAATKAIRTLITK